MATSRRTQSSHSRVRPQPNYTNIHAHCALDDAQIYSDSIKQHFMASTFENVALNSAERSYKKEVAKMRVRSVSNLNKVHESTKQSKQLIMGQPKIMSLSTLTKSLIPSNPETTADMFRLFSTKTQRVPQLSEFVQQGLEQREFLTKKIEKLKRLIMNEKKIKAKTSLKSSKHMNNQELTKYNISRTEEQSRKYNIQIRALANECLDLSNSVQDLKNKNAKLQNKIFDEINLNKTEYSHVKDTKFALIEEQKNLQQIKQLQTVAFKVMTNAYIKMNILKEQKAKLLVNIEQNYNEHK